MISTNMRMKDAKIAGFNSGSTMLRLVRHQPAPAARPARSSSSPIRASVGYMTMYASGRLRTQKAIMIPQMLPRRESPSAPVSRYAQKKPIPMMIPGAARG